MVVRRKDKTSKAVIKLINISKDYLLHHEKPTFIEQLFNSSNNERFLALQDINLEIAKGERIGIIGSNGSGKTTLLKIISGITVPTTGVVETNGKIVSLIELTAGFHDDLTGEENIFLNGVLVGMTRKEIRRKFKKIVAFSEIGSFIDAPLYTYSQGMKLKLGFSVALHANPEILILDEIIAAGDENFRKKITKKMNQMMKKGLTVVVSAHLLDFLRKYCDKIVWLKKGKIVKTGSLSILNEYQKEQT